jgi:uncharacterized protein (DUF2267 family)
MNTNTAPTPAGLPPTVQGMAFLQKVQRRARLEDLYDARDVSEVVFRTLRDMMPNEVVDRVTEELTAIAPEAVGESGVAIADLWQDTNLLVRWLSRVRAPLDISPDSFVFRISQEAGLSRGIAPEDAIAAVFTTLKECLSPERVREIDNYLPSTLRQLWRQV